MPIINVKFAPCPFCGHEPRSISFGTTGDQVQELIVDCTCGAHFELKPDYYYTNDDMFYPYGDAIKLWNTRKGFVIKCPDCGSSFEFDRRADGR